MTEYVLGFCFSEDYSGFRRVLLIRKHDGFLNGLGGKVERDDRDIHDSMRREFREESGIETYTAGWVRFAVMEFPGALVHCFVNRLEWKVFKHAHHECPEGEVVSFQHDDKFYEKMREQNVHPDLHWLIPMANAAYFQRDCPVLRITRTDLPSSPDVSNITFADVANHLASTAEARIPTPDETFCLSR